jgi:hypothetical protein
MPQVLSAECCCMGQILIFIPLAAVFGIGALITVATTFRID